MKTWQKLAVGTAIVGALAFAPKNANGEFGKHFEKQQGTPLMAQKDTVYVNKEAFDKDLLRQKQAVDKYETMKAFAGIAEQWKNLVTLLSEPGMLFDLGNETYGISLKALGEKFAKQVGAANVDMMPINASSAWGCFLDAVKTTGVGKP